MRVSVEPNRKLTWTSFAVANTIVDRENRATAYIFLVEVILNAEAAEIYLITSKKDATEDRIRGEEDWQRRLWGPNGK